MARAKLVSSSTSNQCRPLTIWSTDRRMIGLSHASNRWPLGRTTGERRSLEVRILPLVPDRGHNRGGMSFSAPQPASRIQQTVVTISFTMRPGLTPDPPEVASAVDWRQMRNDTKGVQVSKEHLSEAVVKDLPRLRRYARLLTGNQKLGDVLVVAALHRLTNELTPDRPILDPREFLYCALTETWRSPVNDHLTSLTSGVLDRGDSDERLDKMLPLARAAFILLWVEGFHSSIGAKILQVTEADFDQLIDEAHISISRQMATDVLVIEDELLIAFELEDIMTKLGHRITSVVRTHKMAIKNARRTPPRLILADINLADGSNGIDAVNEILLHVNVPVIFITAYPEKILTGARPEPAFVVTKPFNKEQIQAVVGQALFFDFRARTGVSIEALASELVEGRMADHLN